MNVLVRLLTVMLICMTFSAHASALAQEAQRPAVQDGRLRWERLSPEAKQRARANYKRYRSLNEDERKDLERRVARMKAAREKVLAEMPEEARQKLERLDPKSRHELLHDLILADVGERTGRIREKMAPEFLQKLEAAEPGERARMLHHFKRVQHGRVARHALGRLGKHLGLPEERIQELKDLPPEQRARAVMGLRKTAMEQRIEEEGLPQGMSSDEWKRCSALPPEEFYQRMRDYQQTSHERHRARLPELKLSEETQGKLEKAMRLDASRLTEMSDVPRPERRKRLLEQKRKRCMEVLSSSSELSPGELQELRGLDDRTFFRALRPRLFRTRSRR